MLQAKLTHGDTLLVVLCANAQQHNTEKNNQHGPPFALAPGLQHEVGSYKNGAIYIACLTLRWGSSAGRCHLVLPLVEKGAKVQAGSAH